MKNKLIIFFIILLQISWFNKTLSKEIEFNSSDIEIINEDNRIIANNGVATIKEDEIIIKGVKIEYFKDQSLIKVEKGNISKINNSIKINSDIIEYDIKNSKIAFSGNVKIQENLKNLIIRSNKIIYDVNRQIISSQNNSEILDDQNNIYTVNKFEYSIIEKIVKLQNVKILDNRKNKFDTEIAYLDLEKKELVAKDIGLNLNP